MRQSTFLKLLGFLSVILCSFIGVRLRSQANSVRSMITAPVDQGKLTTLRGNVYPLARAEFDRGAAPASLPMDRMMLVLKRSPQQESALDLLLQQQQDRSSPNYHKWLTPQQFGQQFGPSDQDIQTITSWLQSQGFQNVNVSNGRTVIQFSGTAGQVQQAFHTAIHRYVLANGEEHWANSTDPQIPTALTPVVVGIKQLHNFFPKPLHHVAGTFSRDKATGRVRPQYTFAGGCNNTQTTTGTNCYAVGPYDFATIYNVLPLWNASTPINGTGQTIAIVSDSDIVPSDVTSFTTLFGTTINFNQIQTNPSDDPGVQCPPGTANPPSNCPATGSDGDESEAILDVQWAGSVAPGAQLDLVISASTTTTFGGDTSAQYIINNGSNGLAPILSYSYGECEAGLGTAGNLFYDETWQQAAGEGITVLIATGDNGSAGCEDPNSDSTTAQPATTGLAVSGEATTPYNIAVGGTDFDDPTYPSPYWSSTNGPGGLSANGYIPELAYNDSCTNPILSQFGYSVTPETNCNTASLASIIAPFGGGGGASSCTVDPNETISACSGGYSKPTWQIGPGVPNDGKRDIPDVSLFAGDGFIQSFYVYCEADAGSSCTGTDASTIGGVGGTSVSTQAFAGLMALLDQKTGTRQGNANPMFYTLAAGESASSCASGSGASTCIFNDVTAGTNSMPCERNSLDCTVSLSTDENGQLYANGSPGYNAGMGYDLATGLGSVNAANLANAWGPNWAISATNPAVSISSAGSSGTLTVNVSSVDGFSGTVNFSPSTCSGLPTGATCSVSPNSATLSSTTTSVPVTVTVSTTASSMVGPASTPRDPGIWKPDQIAGVSGGVLLALLFIFFSSSRRRLSRALATLAFASLIALAACGGGSSNSTPSNAGSGGGTTTSGGTPTGTSTATITATSGSVTHTMNFTLTIQ